MDHEFGGGSRIQWRVDRLGRAKEKLGDDWSTGYRAVVLPNIFREGSSATGYGEDVGRGVEMGRAG